MDKPIAFKEEPTFAELWDVCVYRTLYNAADYKQDIEKLFAKLGITKNSSIIDVAAGGGFPAIDLIQDGYEISCTDGTQDEVDLFNKKSLQLGLPVKCFNIRWNKLDETFSPQSFDFLLCRGNSFIYAAGGWNEVAKIEATGSLLAYRQTLSIFYNLLKIGGWIYLDKFKDSETTHNKKIGDMRVGDNPSEELIFWTERLLQEKIRKASIIRQHSESTVVVPNMTYDLSSQEFEQMMIDVRFRNMKKINLPSEQNFDVWIAQK